MFAFLTRLWRRRRDPIDIELDVVEQIVLLHLLRFKAAYALDLRDEALAARSTAAEQQVRLSLIRLESLRLIQRDETVAPELALEPGGKPDRGRRYVITPDGRRVARILPTPPTSSIQTRL